MKASRKLLSCLLALAMACALTVPALAAGPESGEGIVVLFTNDIHCTSDDGMSYAAIAGYKAEMEAQYGADNVTLVDDGDAIQGGILGSMSQGSWIVDIMDEVGYDLAIPGNHEFDFGMDTFLDIAQNQADYTYLSCNFVDANGDPVLEPYTILTYGDVDVAYVGISTPETLSKSAPAYFQDDAGNYIYGFCQGNDGQDLYDQVQETVDAARAAGATGGFETDAWKLYREILHPRRLAESPSPFLQLTEHHFADGRTALIAVNNQPEPFNGALELPAGRPLLDQRSDSGATWRAGTLEMPPNSGLLLLLG